MDGMQTAKPQQRGDIMKMFEGPGEETLDAQQLVELNAARLAFKELEKLVKNIGLYTRKHRSVKRFKNRYFEAMHALLKDRERFSFRIAPYEFTVHEQPVYSNPHPENNFIYKFYMDGVREIAFDDGVPKEELNAFIDVLLTDWNDPALFEDDMVTLMWEQDFAHIKYVVVEGFGEESADGKDKQYTVAGVIEQVRAGADQHLSPPAVAASTPQRRPGRRVRQIGGVVGLRASDLERFEEAPFAMDQQEFEHLRQVIRTTGRETLEKFIEILFKVNLGESDVSEAERSDRIIGLFDRIAGLLLGTGRVGDLERLMRKIHRLGGPEGAQIPQNMVAIRRIFAHWSEEAFVEKVTEGLSNPEFPFTPSVMAIAELLNSEAAVHLAWQAGQVTISERQRQLFELLPRVMAGQELAIAALLSKAEPPHARSLFRVLDATGRPDVLVAAARFAMENPDGSTRFEGLGRLTPQLLNGCRDLLFAALADGEKKVRSKAIQMLARIRSDTVHQRIMAYIEHKDFQGYALDEKRRYFTAAALTGDASAALLELLGTGGVMSRKAQDELRHCAAVALAVSMNAEAIPLFDKELHRRLGHELVLEACTWGLEHMKGGREQRTRQLYDIFFRGELTRVVTLRPHNG